MPRDRAGTFEPQIVPKHRRRPSGFDEAVISLYAKGMTTGDIAAHLEEVYGLFAVDGVAPDRLRRSRAGGRPPSGAARLWL